MKKYSYIIFLILLTGCGFQLRGVRTAHFPFTSIVIHSSDPYDQFSVLLEQTLRAYGIRIAGSAPIILLITAQNFDRSTVGLANVGQTTTYLLTYTVTFELLNVKQQPILPTQTLTIQRNFTISANQISGDLNRQTNLENMMQQDAIQQLLPLLYSPTVKYAIEH